MKATLILAISVMVFCLTPSAAAQSSPRFENYTVRTYTGTIHRPSWIRHVDGSEWRDDLGKLIEPPAVNFAGKYFVVVHSCGTFCRYYTMTDLSSGRDLDLLNDFDAGEPTPKTREGYPYITDLVMRPDSKLLVAHYLVQARRGRECRERAFVLNDRKVTPINGTRRTACPKLITTFPWGAPHALDASRVNSDAVHKTWTLMLLTAAELNSAVMPTNEGPH